MALPIDTKVKERIHWLVSQGFYKLADVKPRLHEYVRTEFRGIKPPPWNTRYYPTDRDIKNHVQLAKAAAGKTTTEAPTTVPEILFGLPLDKIPQCLERLKSSKTIAVESIVALEMSNSFQVESTVVNMSHPHCECFDWIASKSPCKHMFAIMNCKGVSLPQHYLTNEWIRNDENDVIYTDDIGNENLEEVVIEESRKIEEECSTLTSHSPDKIKKCKSLTVEIRERVGALTNLSSLLNDCDVLEHVNHALEELISFCKANVQIDTVVNVQATEKNNKRKQTTGTRRSPPPKRKATAKRFLSKQTPLLDIL